MSIKVTISVPPNLSEGYDIVVQINPTTGEIKMPPVQRSVSPKRAPLKEEKRGRRKRRSSKRPTLDAALPTSREEDISEFTDDSPKKYPIEAEELDLDLDIYFAGASERKISEPAQSRLAYLAKHHFSAKIRELAQNALPKFPMQPRMPPEWPSLLLS